jgi:hypothetical protein
VKPVPLSTSNSEPASRPDDEQGYFPAIGSPSDQRRIRHAIASFIVLLVLLLLSAELATRYLYPRISRIEQRVVQDQREVATIKPAGTPPTMLLAGNSLLLHGLDYPKIRTELAPDARIVRFAIENTEFVDWFYGLRQLFARGIKPSKVFLCLNLGQALSHSVLEESAWHLFGARDLLAVGRETGMDHTQTSNLIFDHWSSFYANRAGLRNYILNITDRRYADELHALARHPPNFPPEEEMLAQARVRLRRFKELCDENGVEFVLLIAPELNNQNNLILAKAASMEHVDIEVPIAEGALGPEFFQADRFHLNEKGTAVFTEALTRDLRSRLPVH